MRAESEMSHVSTPREGVATYDISVQWELFTAKFAKKNISFLEGLRIGLDFKLQL